MCGWRSSTVTIGVGRSAGTRRAHTSGWLRFEHWCTLRDHQMLPALVAFYLRSRFHLSSGSITSPLARPNNG